MPRTIALLRAVNVGGAVARSTDLVRCWAEEGLLDVTTLLASGNVVFRGDRRPLPALERALEGRCATRLGLTTEIFLRTGADWRAALAANPYPEAASEDPAHLLLAVLRDAPAAGAEARLAAAVRGRERTAVVGRHAYLVYPDGVGRSKLTLPVVERALGVAGTCRNWNTAAKLLALAER